MLILAGVSIAILTGENGIFTKAEQATFITEMSQIKEELELYKVEKTAENIEFVPDSLSASRANLSYNTQKTEEKGTIYDVMPSLSSKWEENIEVIKGQILFSSQDIKLLELAQKAGLEINPYKIVNGELLSADTNLLLMDSTGKIVIPDRVTKIGNGAFKNLDGLKTIVIPGTVKEIGNYAFSGNKTLENVYMEEGVEKIGSFAFEGCTALAKIQIANSVYEIGNTCFANCTSLEEVNIPSSLTVMSYRLFSGCSSIISVDIPEGITTLQGAVFEGCTSLSNIKFPSTLSSIGSGVFSYLDSLKEIQIDSNNKTYSFQDAMLMSKDKTKLYIVLSYVTTLSIPQTVISIQTDALSACNRLAELTITKNVNTINSIFNSYMKNIKVEEGNTSFKSINGNLYDYNMTTLIKYCSDDGIVTIPDGVKILKEYAFRGKTKLQEIILPDSIEEIKSFCFSSSTLKKINIPKNVKKIDYSAFSGQGSLGEITISSENETYKSEDNTMVLSKDGKKLYFVTKDLENYTIPESVEEFKSGCFYTRVKMKSFVIPNSVKIIEDAAFDNCVNLEKIEIPITIQTIGNTAFSRCHSLKEILIDKKEGQISGAPWGCPYGLRAVKWNTN